MPLLKCSASKAKPKNGITYITDPKKAKIVTVRNLFEDEDYAKQFEETGRAVSLTKGNITILSCLVQEKIMSVRS